MPPLVEVLLPKPIDHPFHYRVPEPLQTQAQPGVRAVVPFGHELLTGIIVQTGTPPPSHAAQHLRSVHLLLDQAPLLSADLIALLRRSADYYAAPWGELLRTALPPPLLPSGERRLRCLEAVPQKPPRSQLAQQLLELLRHHPRGLSQRTLLKRVRASSPDLPPPKVMAALRRLATTGWITIDSHIHPLKPPSFPIIGANIPILPIKNPILEVYSSHFRNIAASLSNCLNNQRFVVFLYQSPQAGGCQQGYLAAAAAVLQAGQSLLLLAPEIARAEQLAASLQARFRRPVILLHSGLSPRHRARQWLALCAAGAPQIVVGGRSALFAPVPSLGLIIVDEEADPLYKQEERPRLHARDVAILRAQQARIPILLGGRFISVESYWHGQMGKYRWSDEQITFSRDVVTRLINLRSEPLLDGLLTKPLIEAIHAQLARREQTLLLVNRRGYAPGLICRDCGELMRCPTCRSALSFYKLEAVLRCRYCGLCMTAPTCCPACRGYRLGPLGTGTQRVEEALRRQWPQARLARIDRDMPARPDAEAELLIGTQLCLHRLPPPRLSLAAVLDAELDLSRPDFRAEERAMQLLIRLQGLLDSAPGSATLLIQSHQPERPALQALATGSPASFYETELRQRQQLGYPPFSRLAVVQVSGGQIEQLAKQVHHVTAAPTARRVEVWGPVPVAGPRRLGQSCQELLLKAATPSALHQAVAAIKALPLAARLERQGALQIEIDPA